LSAFAGRPLDVDPAVYTSESESGFRNRAIAWMLRNAGISSGDPMPALENYFRQCALEVTCRDLAYMAATLANGGVNPRTGQRVASTEDVEAVLSVMATCGMYDYAGNWLYTVGMPAKSGVGGGVIAVLPGRFGIAVFSPPLDDIGNSARGIAVCQQISRDFGLHVFGSPNVLTTVVNRDYSGADAPSRRVRPDAQQSLLDSHTGAIRYLELQGALAVDGVEFICRRMARMAPDCRYFILDVHRISSITPSAARLLQQTAGQLASDGRTLVYSRLRGKAGIQEALQQAANQVGHALCAFDDNDLAAEWCENALLNSLSAAPALPAGVSLDRFALVAGVEPPALEQLNRILHRVTPDAGTILIATGTQNDDRIFFILQGEVSVLLTLPDGASQRVAILGAGAVVGEMALLGQRLRTATVRVEKDAVCLSLSNAALDQLALEYPQLKIRMLHNLAEELANKLRQANQLISVLAT